MNLILSFKIICPCIMVALQCLLFKGWKLRTWLLLQWKMSSERNSTRQGEEMLWPPVLHQGVQGHQSEGVCSREWGTSSQETLRDFAAISAGIACQVVWFSSCSPVHINNTDLLSLCFPFSSSFFPCKYKPPSPFVSPERAGAPFQQLFRCEAVQHSKFQL